MISALFLIASIGAINGFVLSIYLLLKKSRSLADLLFGGLIFSLSVRIGKSVFFYFDRDVDSLILQIGLSACLFIGPFFFLLLKSLQNEAYQIRRTDRITLMILVISILAIGIIWPYRTQPEIWNRYIVQGIYLSWSSFVIIGLINSRQLLKRMFSNPKQLDKRERYIIGIILSTLFITVTYQFALFVTGFTYIWGAIAFSASFYYLGFRVLMDKRSLTPKGKKSAPLANGRELFQKIESLVKQDKPHTQKGLKLGDLAEKTALSKHLLSRVLNEHVEGGFAQYIKMHRVNEAKNLIQVRDELSLEGIGFEAGFSSKSAFFEAFKKVTNQTPAEFKQQRTNK